MAAAEPSTDDPASYCAAQVRAQDYDRYLTVLFAPAARRADLFALYAFNLEVAKTAEVVSEPLLGHMRLEWWREAIAAAYDGQPAGHQVLLPLAAAIARRGLSRARFETLIEARAFDLDPEPPASLAELEDYAEATSASLILLALEALDVRGDAAAEAARRLGIAWSLVGLLRAVPFHARQQRLYLPRDLVRAHDLRVGELFALRSPEGLGAVVAAVAARARAHLEAARTRAPEVPRAARPVLLPAVLARRALARLAAARYDPFAAPVQAPVPGRAWRLFWANLCGRY